MGQPPSQSLKSAAAVVLVLKVRVVGRQELQRPAGQLSWTAFWIGKLVQGLLKASSKLLQSGFKADSKLVQHCFKTWFTQFTPTSLSSPSAQLLKLSTPKIDLVLPHFAPAAALVVFFAISRVAAWILPCLKADHSP